MADQTIPSIKNLRGNIGIGTANPSKKLHIDGDIKVKNSGKLFLWNDNDNNYLDYQNWIASTGNAQLIRNTGSGGIKLKSTSLEVYVNTGLGVGTSTPLAPLHVQGTALTGYVSGDVNADTMMVVENDGNARLAIVAGSISDLFFGDAADQDVGRIRYNHSSDSMAFFTAGAECMRIKDSGDVGIGTTSPNYLLDVEKAGAAMRVYNLTDNGNTDLRIQTAGSTGSSRIFFGDFADSDVGSIIYRHNGNSLAFETNDAERMRINSVGDVGIGTTSTNAKLDIRGGVFISGNHTDTGGQLNVWCDSNGHGNLAVYDFCIKTGANNSRTLPFFISNIGSVGIGTTSINTGIKLQVTGGIYTTTGYVYAKFIRADYFSSGQNLELQSGGSGKVQLRTSNNVQLESNNDGCTRLSHVGSTTGGKFLVRTYSGNDYLNVFSSEYSSGSLCLGYGAAGKNGDAGFVSTYDNFSGHKSIFKVNHNGITVLTTGNAAVDTVGDDLSMAERFSVQVDKSYFNNGPVGVGTDSPDGTFHVKSTGNGESYVERASGAKVITQAQSGKGVIGTYSNHPLSLSTNSGERVFITTGGNVGIGVADPASKLEVGGSFRISSSAPVMFFEDSSGAPYDAQFSYDNDRMFWRWGGGTKLYWNSSGTLYFGDYDANQATDHATQDPNIRKVGSGADIGDLRFRTNHTDRMHIDGPNGKIGIGTTNPDTLLHLSGSTNQNLLRIENQATSLSMNDALGGIEFENRDTTDDSPNIAASIFALAGPSGGSGALDFRTTPVGYEATAATSTMFLDHSGEVGIGTTTPAEKLEVAGNIALRNGTNATQIELYETFTDGSNYERTQLKHTGGYFTINPQETGTGTQSGIDLAIGGTSKLKIEPEGNVLINGAGHNSNKADFSVGAGGSPRVSWHGNQVQIGGTDMNYNGNISYSTSVFRMQSWQSNISFELKGTSGTANRDIIFRPFNGTADTEAMRLKGDGKLGIGTSSPDGLLMIRKDQTAPTKLIISNGGTAGADTSSRLSFYEGTSEKSYIERKRDGSGITKFHTPATDNPIQWTNATGEYMRFVGGNVGIGTSSPSHRLDVVGTYRISDNTTNANNKLHRMLGRHYTNAEQDVNIFSSISTSSTNVVSFGGGSSSYNTATHILFYTASNNTSTYAVGQERFRIHNDGNIGIAVGSPQQKLDVDGAIKSKIYTVNTLPTANSSAAGARAFVSDSQMQASGNFGATIAGYGSGSYTVPVWCDGAYWYIG